MFKYRCMSVCYYNNYHMCNSLQMLMSPLCSLNIHMSRLPYFTLNTIICCFLFTAFTINYMNVYKTFVFKRFIQEHTTCIRIIMDLLLVAKTTLFILLLVQCVHNVDMKVIPPTNDVVCFSASPGHIFRLAGHISTSPNHISTPPGQIPIDKCHSYLHY